MNKELLLKLADLLERDAANPKGVKFDLSFWALRDDSSEEFTLNCNTTACAMGLAALSGEFPGLRINSESSITGRIELDGVPSLNYGFYAAAELFGISVRVSEMLFGDNNYPLNRRRGAVAERYVAQRIRLLVELGNVDAAIREQERLNS